MKAKNKIIFLCIVLYLSLLYTFTVQAQARLVINNDGYIVIDNAAKLVVANGNSNAIVSAGTGANIISEGEYNQVKWNLGGTGGVYAVPFTNDAGIKIPVILSVAVPGDYGYLSFSTYMEPDWNNANYLPSDVTHINNSSGSNNSSEVIDRFWIIEPETAAQTPGMGTLSFNYDDAEHLVAGNTITESNLKGQRFNPDLNSWGDYIPSGVVNTVTNTVDQIAFNGNFYRSWTLVDAESPMPVELITYDYECNGDMAELKWITLTESNNDYFTIESSENGINFYPVLTVNGAGNSTVAAAYNVNVISGKYYRLTQTDYNGMKEELGILMTNCKDESGLVYWQSMDQLREIKVSGLTEGMIFYSLYDIGGKLIIEDKYESNLSSEIIHLPELPNGIYTISIQNGGNEIAGKIMIVN